MQQKRPSPQRRQTPPRQAPRRPASANPAARRPAPSRQVAARRPVSRRKKNPRARFIGLALIVLAIAILWFAIDTMVVLGLGDNQYYNVYVNGISLKGMSRLEASEMFKTLEENWSTRSLTLEYGDSQWEFSPNMVNAQLDIQTQLDLAWNYGHVGNLFTRKSQARYTQKNPQYYYSEITYDESLMDAFLSNIQASTDAEPVDAVVVLGVDKPSIQTNSVDGSSLDVEATRETLVEWMTTGQDGDTATLKVDVLEPAIQSSDVSTGLHIIVQYSTEIASSSGSNRYKNIVQALTYFNALEVTPGMEVSVNDVFRKRNQINGYYVAAEYSEGTTRDAYGGGVCQASSTIYGAVIRAGMTIVRRSPHSMTVAYLDPSLDAAITDSGSKDLVFRNDTESPIYIYSEVSGKKAIVTIYGNRPPYRYELISKVIEKSIPSTKVTTLVDTEGEYVTYTDEQYVDKGKDGCRSEGWLISYDWETGEEVAREKVSTDTYSAGTTFVYVGAKERPTPTATGLPPLSTDATTAY